MTSGFAQTVPSALLRRACTGDMKAHEQLFRLFGTPVFTLARRLVRRVDVAEEITQETFLDVMRRIGSYRGEAPFGFWLRQIALNRCLMFLRSYAEQNGEVLQDEPADHVASLDSALVRADLQALLERLPLPGRAVLWLHEVEGYTHQEIGQMLGRTASFSKSQLARAHARLRTMLGNIAEVKSCTPTRAN